MALMADLGEEGRLWYNSTLCFALPEALADGGVDGKWTSISILAISTPHCVSVYGGKK
jgi:hypothetical protein